MRISFIVNPVYINDGWSPWDTRIGGSEESIVKWAAEFTRKGHTVSVYHNGKHGDFNGVAYKDHADFESGDVTINVNYPQFNTPKPCIYVTSLTSNANLGQFDVVVAISQYALHNTGIKHINTHVVPLGYDSTVIYPQNKVKKQCFYASSPDRGLSVLLDAWPEVYGAHPDATLLVTYGGQIDLPGVINLGEVDEDTMNDIYNTSDVWCHPCTGAELYCIVGKKAQAAGCIPVIIPTMALDETVYTPFKTTKENYTQTLIGVLDKTSAERNIIRQDIVKHSYTPNWKESSERLMQIIQSVV